MKYLTFSLKSQQKVTQTDCDVSVQCPCQRCILPSATYTLPLLREICIKLEVCGALNVTFAFRVRIRVCCLLQKGATELTPGKPLQKSCHLTPPVPLPLPLPVPPFSQPFRACFRCVVIF